MLLAFGAWNGFLQPDVRGVWFWVSLGVFATFGLVLLVVANALYCCAFRYVPNESKVLVFAGSMLLGLGTFLGLAAYAWYAVLAVAAAILVLLVLVNAAVLRGAREKAEEEEHGETANRHYLYQSPSATGEAARTASRCAQWPLLPPIREEEEEEDEKGGGDDQSSDV